MRNKAKIQFEHNGRRYKVREFRSKSMPGYIYHVLTVAGRTVEAPCLSDAHSVARMVIDGELSLDGQPEFCADDAETLDAIVFG